MIARHSSFWVFTGLTLLCLIVYYPALAGFFLADDNAFMAQLVEHANAYLQGDGLLTWLFTLHRPVFFRPMTQWLWLMNYVMWGTAPFGHHLISVLLHALNALLVYALVRVISKHRWVGIVAGTLFALQPIHAESVAWISDNVDVLGAFFSLLAALFFVLYRERGVRRYLGVSLVALLGANLTKESTLTLPAILLVYDLLFHFARLRWRILGAQMLVWAVLGGYMVFRIFFFGLLSVYHSPLPLPELINLFAHYYTIAFVQPFFADLGVEAYWMMLGVFALLAAMYRRRKIMWLGIGWTLVAMMPALSVAYPAPRLAYIPSLGFVIALAAIVAQPLPPKWRGARVAGGALTLFFAGAYALGLNARVENWATAGKIAASVVAEMSRLFPASSPDARFYLIGVPKFARGVPVILDDLNLKMALGIGLRRAVDATLGAKFPLVDTRLDNTFFLEYRQRRLTERPEVREALRARAQCLTRADPVIAWGTTEWEIWNDLAELESHEPARALRATGTDPILGSPPFELSTLALADVEITMRVRAAAPTTRGEVFWLATEQTDFFPGISESFIVQADGAWHTYRVNIGRSGKLFFGDAIRQLRFDPTDTPAEIAIRAIRVTSYCAADANQSCQCAP